MFNLKKTILSMLLVLSMGALASAQQMADSLVVYFRQGSAAFDRGYRQNGERCEAFLKTIKEMPDLLTVVKVEYYGVTSPEGSVGLNEKLSIKRAEVITDYLHKHIKFDDDVVFVYSVVEDWAGLEKFVMNDLQTPDREAVLQIIRSDRNELREKDLRELNGGAAWRYLYRKYFYDLRFCRVIVSTELGIEFADIIIEEDEIVLSRKSPLERRRAVKDLLAFMPDKRKIKFYEIVYRPLVLGYQNICHFRSLLKCFHLIISKRCYQLVIKKPPKGGFEIYVIY